MRQIAAVSSAAEVALLADLTELEWELVKAARRGGVLDCGQMLTEELATTGDPSRVVRAEVFRELLLGRRGELDPRGVRVVGALVTGELDLSYIHAQAVLSVASSVLDARCDLSYAHLVHLALRGSRLVELHAEGLRVDGSVILDRGFRACGTSEFGTVQLLGAQIHGNLEMSGAELTNTTTSALHADRLQVDGNVFLDGFRATGVSEDGAVRLRGAHIHSILDLGGAKLANTSGPALVADGLQVDGDAFLHDGFQATAASEHGTVRLLGAHIYGNLNMDGAELTNTAGPALRAGRLQVDGDAFFRDGFRATGSGDDGTMRLLNAHIHGRLSMRGARLENTSPGLALELERVVVRSLQLPATTICADRATTIHPCSNTNRHIGLNNLTYSTLARNGKPLGQMDNSGVAKGMSGAPVMRVRDNMVLGVVSGRFNTADGWVRDRVWVSRVEDLLPLLAGIAEPDVERRAINTHPLAVEVLTPDFNSAIIRPYLSGFVGRHSYVDAILKHLDDPTFPSGYILLTGEPGIGKTALMAYLVHTQGWIHHFNMATSGLVSAAAFLRNVCAQLIINYQLRYSQLPVRATQDGLFLQRLLGEARDSTASGRVVVAVDAIDEATDEGISPQTNRLFLPKTLPDGVYFVVSSRTRNRYELDSDRLRHVEIDEGSVGNIDDLTAFIRHFIDRHSDAMLRVLQATRTNEDELINVFLERSEGNFLYAKCVLPELARGVVQDLQTLQALPLGLTGYYTTRWEKMRRSDPELFEELHRPVIQGFAVFLQTTASMIAETYNIPVPRVRQAIDMWREFLNEGPGDGRERHYRIYHKTFLDFLRTTAGIKEAEDVVIDTVWREIKWDER